MPEAAEAVVEAPVGSVEGRPGVTVVTSENMKDYVEQELGPAESVIAENEDPEAVAKAEFEAQEATKAAEKAKAEGPKEGDIDGANVFFNGKWVKKHDFNYRLHLKTEEAKAEARKEIERAEQDAKTIREQLQKAADERDALKAKYEPPKSDELGPEPTPEQFTDVAEYAKALKDWTADKTRKDDAAAQAEQQAKIAHEGAVKAWNERQEALKKEVPDYAQRLEKSPVMVSDAMRDAILDNEQGPKILLYLADNPEVGAKLKADAEKLGQCPLDMNGMMAWHAAHARLAGREIVRIEAALGSADKPQTKSAPAKNVAEVSKAPAPITPLRGGGAPVDNKVDAEGKFYGSYEEYKDLRKAGKIK